MNKNLLYPLACALSAVFLGACSDWTDPESLEIKVPTVEERYPTDYANYIANLNRYKQEAHKTVFVSIDNVQAPTQQAHRLTAMPDSIDYICLNHPQELSEAMVKEMEEVRLKGTKVIYTVDYDLIEKEWKAKTKENPNLTEEDALKYIVARTEEQLALCTTFNYDGFIANYTGLSLVSMVESVLATYNARQQAFLNTLATWKKANPKKSMSFYGNVQYLVPANMTLLADYDFLILKSLFSTNADDLSLKAFLAIEAGKDAPNEEVTKNPVPSDRFVAIVNMPIPNDKKKEQGYWSTIDSAGETVIAAYGAAAWIREASPNYTRKGIMLNAVQQDYFNNEYAQVREIIQIMNPYKTGKL